MADCPTLRLSSAADYSLAELARLCTRGYADYIVPVDVGSDGLAERIRVESIDLACSWVVNRGDEPVGVTLVARRGSRSRVAAMGVVPEARRSGVGRLAMERVVDDARARGDLRLILEVIESNQPALELYRSVGFRVVRRLVGYRVSEYASGAAQIVACEPSEIGKHLASSDEAWPWQLAPASFANLTAPHHGFTLEERAFAVVSKVSDDELTLRGIFTLPEHRGRGVARRLLAALAHRFPNRAISFIALIPEDVSPGFFRRIGFELGPLAQFEMEHSASASSRAGRP